MRRRSREREERPSKMPRVSQMPRAVQSQLDHLVNTGRIAPTDLDQRVLESLSGFEASIGLKILEAFAAADLKTITNKAAFLAGILKRFRGIQSQQQSQHNQQQEASQAQTLALALQIMANPLIQTNNIIQPNLLLPNPLIQTNPLNPLLLSLLLQQQPVQLQQVQEISQPSNGKPVGPHVAQQYGGIAPSVQAKLEVFYKRGLLRRDELDQRILDSLAQFPPSTGEAILDKFMEADLPSISNKNGFLAGIMRRFRGNMAPTRSDPARCMQVEASLPISVQQTLDSIYRSGQCEREDLDAACLQKLGELDEDTACDALIRFSKAPLSTITNKSGFLVGIIKRSRENKVNNSPPPAPQQSATDTLLASLISQSGISSIQQPQSTIDIATLNAIANLNTLNTLSNTNIAGLGLADVNTLASLGAIGLNGIGSIGGLGDGNGLLGLNGLGGLGGLAGLAGLAGLSVNTLPYIQGWQASL